MKVFHRKNRGTIHLLVSFCVCIWLLCSCQLENVSDDSLRPQTAQSVTQDVFDWENADYMPVPSGHTL